MTHLAGAGELTALWMVSSEGSGRMKSLGFFATGARLRVRPNPVRAAPCRDPLRLCCRHALHDLP